jgi:hypothetical protein
MITTALPMLMTPQPAPPVSAALAQIVVEAQKLLGISLERSGG